MEESKARTRARLIAAARKVFLRRGFHAASLEAIAEEAGYTIGAVYSNFEGKSELFVAVFEDYVAGRVKEIEAVAGSALAPEDQTSAGAVQWMEKLAAEPDWFPLFIEFWSHAARDRRLRRKFAIPLGAVRVAIARIVERHAHQRGIELSLPAEQIGTAIKALGNGIALEKIADPDAVPEELFGASLAIFLRGLEADAQPRLDQGDQSNAQLADSDQKGPLS
jgi:AcrR family transcriptional regulator